MLIEVSKLSNLSASIASRVYPNNSLSGQLVQSGGTRDRGVNIVSVPTKSGRLATMLLIYFGLRALLPILVYLKGE